MKALIFAWNIIGLANSLGIVNKSVVRSVNPQTYTLYCAKNGVVGMFNPFCINCWQIRSPCDFLLGMGLVTPQYGGGTATVALDLLDFVPGSRKTKEDVIRITKQTFFKEAKLVVNIGLEFVNAGLLGGEILNWVADKIFDEIQKSDKDLKDIPELEIEKWIYGILKLKGCGDWAVGIKKIINSTRTKNIKIIFKTSKKTLCLIC